MNEENINPWVVYDGNYSKQEYDLLLKNNEVILNCWPNAGSFTELLGKRIIKGEQVLKIRESFPTSWDLLSGENWKE